MNKLVGRDNWSSRIFHLCSVSLISGVMMGTITVEAEDKVEAVKKFLQSPPSVEAVLYQHRNLARKGIDTANLHIPPPTGKFNYYQGAWKGESFFIRQIKTLEQAGNLISQSDADNNTLFTGIWRSRHWFLFGTELTTWVPPDSMPIDYSLEHQDQNRARQSALQGRIMLLQTLNLGIFDMMPATMKWSGDDFEARSGNGNKLKGRLIAVGDVPTEIRIDSQDENVFYSCELNYSKDNQLPLGLPDLLKQSWVKSGSKDIVQEIQILSLKFNSNDADDDLDPRGFISAQKIRSIVYTNGNFYEIRGAQMHLQATRRIGPVVPVSEPVRRWVVFVLLSTISAGSFLLVLFWMKKQSTRK